MKVRQITARLTLAAVVPAVGLIAVAGPAEAARPRSGTTPASCDVEDSGTGKTSQVPEGTRVGLMTCGADGQWHFGWLVDARIGSTPMPPMPPVRTPGAAAPMATTAVASRRG